MRISDLGGPVYNSLIKTKKFEIFLFTVIYFQNSWQTKIFLGPMKGLILFTILK